jgi:hypothetical protein
MVLGPRNSEPAPAMTGAAPLRSTPAAGQPHTPVAASVHPPGATQAQPRSADAALEPLRQSLQKLLR